MFSHQSCAVSASCICVKGWAARLYKGPKELPAPKRSFLAATRMCLIFCPLVTPVGEGPQVTRYNSDGLWEGHVLHATDCR